MHSLQLLCQILFLAAVQGAAELLPVSSSAHVIIAEKLMGLDPTTPLMTLVLVCLHTGTMFAVIWYFRKDWRQRFFSSKDNFMRACRQIVIATLATGVLGLLLKYIIEKITHNDIEALFGNLGMIGLSLLVVGTLIIFTDRKVHQKKPERQELSDRDSFVIGLAQGLCLPFRGLSRSGVTISTALLQGIEKVTSEGFSFALAVVLTPPVLAKELHRFWKQSHVAGATFSETLSSSLGSSLSAPLVSCLLGVVMSFIAGLIALKFLSRWLEGGLWRHFGYYCYLVAIVAFALAWGF